MAHPFSTPGGCTHGIFPHFLSCVLEKPFEPGVCCCAGFLVFFFIIIYLWWEVGVFLSFRVEVDIVISMVD
jgi:hypothetical protein